jgi:membrane fusion protein (multidrug efflux system)
MKPELSVSGIFSIKQALEKKLFSHKMAKPILKTIGLLLLLFGLIFGYKFYRIFTFPPYVPPPVTVASARVRPINWQPIIKAVGTLRAIQGVDITTEAAGMITNIYLKSGEETSINEPLIQLNADVETAQAASLKAQVELAEITLKRDKSQRAIQAISQATIDADQADLKNKKAQLAEQEATIAKKTIKAPFGGILGICAVNKGQYLNTGDKIVTLQSINPVLIDFHLPQQALASIKKGQKVSLKTDTYPGEAFVGEITSLDPQVDSSTRNVQIEATVPNDYLKLYPGMFVEVEIYTDSAKPYLIIPKAAVSYNSFGEIIFTIKQTGKDKMGKPVLTANQSFITVGESRGGQVAVLKGLSEGDEVVVAGQIKLKNGTSVVINNTVLPVENTTSPLLDDQE